jgi:hypothetical protein
MRGHRNIRTTKGILFISLTALMGVLLSTTSTLAQSSSAQSDDWQFGLSIYGWFPDISGQTAFGRGSGGGEFEIAVEDILDNLEFILMGTFDMRKGRFGLLTDAIYMDLGGSQSGVRLGSAGGSANANVELDVKSLIWLVTGYYRTIDNDNVALDILAGARYIDLEQSVDYTVTAGAGALWLPGPAGSRTAEARNWDGVVGVRGRFGFGAQQGLFLPCYLDVGAGDSDLTWQGMAGLGYAFSWGEVVAAWRYLYYDMPSDKPIDDMDFSGPAVGVTFRF